MKRIWTAFCAAFWASFYEAAAQHAPDRVLTLKVEIDDAEAVEALDRWEGRLIALRERAYDIQRVMH